MKTRMTVGLGIRYLLWYLLSIPVAWFSPVRKNRVIVGSNRGEGLSGNGIYLFETWLKDREFDVWAVFSSRELCREMSGRYDHVLFAFSWKALKTAAQARFFILTHGRLDVPYSGIKKTIIQTWHGIPFKAIGFFRNDKFRDRIRNLLYKRFDYDSVDFFLSSSPYVTELYMGVFHQEQHKFLEIGFPRNDIFMQGKGRSISEPDLIFKRNTPPRRKIVFYAPTYRPYPSRYFPFIDREKGLPAFVDLLERTETICLVKSHANQRLELDHVLEESGRVLDISDDMRYPDIQRILHGVDILITDYSSISIDALLLDMPCLYITSDVDDYVHATGRFCCDYDLLAAGAHVRSMSDMIGALNELIGGNDRFKEGRRSARGLFFTQSSDTSTGRLLSFMKGLVSD